MRSHTYVYCCFHPSIPILGRRHRTKLGVPLAHCRSSCMENGLGELSDNHKHTVRVHTRAVDSICVQIPPPSQARSHKLQPSAIKRIQYKYSAGWRSSLFGGVFYANNNSKQEKKREKGKAHPIRVPMLKLQLNVFVYGF